MNKGERRVSWWTRVRRRCRLRAQAQAVVFVCVIAVSGALSGDVFAQGNGEQETVRVTMVHGLVLVALVPQDPEAPVDLFRRDQSDFDGTFLLRRVIQGTYTVAAVEDAWGFDCLKAGVLARYVQKGQNVIEKSEE
jgi:hypothetical protein